MKKLIFSKECQSIIYNAIKRNWNKKDCTDKGIYVENHHIFPKSLYPELRNVKWNIICVTYEEHFIIHKEMVHSNPEIKSLRHAWNKMCNGGSKNQNRDMNISIDDLIEARILHADAMRGENNMNYNGLSEEHKKHISESMLGKKKSIEAYPNRIEITCCEYPELIFKSFGEAERKCKELGFKGVFQSSLSKYIKGDIACSYCGKDSNGIKLHWIKL